MNDQASLQVPSTPEAVRATSALREADSADEQPPRRRMGTCTGEGEAFTLGDAMSRVSGYPYEHIPGNPLYRPLRIYTVDPGTPPSEGGVAVVNIPFEPLANGIAGRVFHVEPVLANPSDEDSGKTENVNLNEPSVLLTNGVDPSPVEPRFHQQMVYAVASLVYASFRRALGRHLGWGFEAHPDDSGHARLHLKPHGRRGPGASYDRDGGEIFFGFIRTEESASGRAVPGGLAFSCVSHDIVSHEVTHALLDGLRAHFLEPTSPDVLGFHEGFADVIALLHRFSYTEVVRAAVRRCRGELLQSLVLTSIANEFGLEIGIAGPVRRVGKTPEQAGDGAAVAPALRSGGAESRANAGRAVPTYSEDLDPHTMGTVFVSAVFHAFAAVFARKTERYMRLASNGTGVLPKGDIPTDLQDVLVEEASQLASQFLNVCIRAIDYCPPVDLQLGEFLRAVITADLDLVPDDPWGYREAWITAFAQHGIRPRGVLSMSEDQLRWPFVRPADEKATDGKTNGKNGKVDGNEELRVEALSFSKLEFNGDPACAASPAEVRKRACALGRFAARHLDRFGLLKDGDPLLNGDRVDLPQVQSVRSSRRVGPDGQVVFDLVAEVTQTRYVNVNGKPSIVFRGGCTVILGPHGEVRYLIRKGVGENSRVFRQTQFMAGAGAAQATVQDDGYQVADSRKVQFTPTIE